MYLFSALHGQGTSCTPVGQRHPDRVQAGHEVPVLAQTIKRRLAHPGHDSHRRGDVGRIGQLHADVGDRGARAGPSRTGPRTSCVRASTPRTAPSGPRISSGSRQLLVGPASDSSARADERAILDPGDVSGVGEREVRVRPLGVGKALESARFDERLQPAGRTHRPTRRTSGCRRAGSVRRPPLPTLGAERGSS